MKQEKKFNDILSRFRNDVIEYSEKFGGLKRKAKIFKAPVPRKEKRKLERKLKGAKKLAFSRKEKIPTLDDLTKKKSKIKDQKKNTPIDKDETEIQRIKKEPKKISTDENINTVLRIENRIKKENREKQKYLDSYQNVFKEKLVKDNEEDEKEIRKLENKKYKQAFYDEGFADLLDFCDEEKRQDMVKNEVRLGYYEINIFILNSILIFHIGIKSTDLENENLMAS
ncbi:hypothetical protein BpHYR1_017010 [Brachionus plicatilis]|uniref:Uncharacterized protein n=1 Tax=Brachionus plicatilis TaxID=10195 RepID=A0A3M7PY99_BRAPC|nr:hypothetical protein BpHYR1_017010 [Brachionus plicatilis]